MKKAILTILCLSLSAGALFAQGTTPGGMPLPGNSNQHPQKTPEQRAEAERAAGATSPTQNVATSPATPPAAQQAVQPVAASVQADAKAGKFKFEKETHDYGNVPEGPVATYDFKFKNVGKSPIVITDAHGSCGCTTATYPHDPILPKHSGVIHAMYNTVNRPGAIAKDIIINSNAQQSPMILHITGNVTAKPAGK